MSEYTTLLREAGCDERVIQHCRAVTALALELASSDPLYDLTLIEAGGMLHDIGRSVTHGIGHAQAGAALLRAGGWPDAICRIVERHTGAGLTADENALLRLVPRDCVPVTPEERLIAYADKRLSGIRVISMERELARSFALPHRSRRRMSRLWQEMEILTG